MMVSMSSQLVCLRTRAPGRPRGRGADTVGLERYQRQIPESCAMFDLVPVPVFALALAITFLGGFVKGAVGFALPLIMMSGLGAILPPEVALAGLILPAVVANCWQAFRQGLGGALNSIRGHWPFIVIGMSVMMVSAQIVLDLPQWLFFALIGVPISLYSALQLMGVPLRVAPHRRRHGCVGEVGQLPPRDVELPFDRRVLPYHAVGLPGRNYFKTATLELADDPARRELAVGPVRREQDARVAEPRRVDDDLLGLLQILVLRRPELGVDRREAHDVE